jgi:predicted methyltransferase
MLIRTLAVGGLAAASLLALTACEGMPGMSSRPKALAADDYGPILSDPARTVKLEGQQAADQTDDAARKPAEVLAFSKIAPGQTILELEGGRGWYSEIISKAIGPTGKLYVQYPAEFGYGDAAYKTRMDAGQLKNATIVKSHFDDYSAIPSNSVDKVIWILGPHEIYFVPPNTQGLGDEAKTYAEIKRVLKPGGEFIAMDHAADAGAPKNIAQTLHRTDPANVLAAAKAAGLTYVEKSDILANKDDDRTKRVFDATIRRHPDQCLYRFQK